VAPDLKLKRDPARRFTNRKLASRNLSSQMKKLIIIIPLVIFLAYEFWPERRFEYPPGVLVPEIPKQTNLKNGKEWHVGEFKIKALAEFDITARILSLDFYSYGKESKLSPVDLALGWEKMSDQSVLDRIEISQGSRWYNWRSDNLPIPASEISCSSANVHIIPGDDTIKDKLDDLYKGSLIRMKGYLVEIHMANGWHWISSLRRDDTEGGACEVFWVNDLEILDPQTYNGELKY
jgi:hypothetical protein